MASKFSNWITESLNERGWNQATLARASGLTPTAISDLVNDRRNPGKDSCIAIAKAFKLPREFVFQVAGILEDEESENRLVSQAVFLPTSFGYFITTYTAQGIAVPFVLRSQAGYNSASAEA